MMQESWRRVKSVRVVFSIHINRFRCARECTILLLYIWLSVVWLSIVTSICDVMLYAPRLGA